MSEIFGSCFLANNYSYVYWFDSILTFSFFLLIILPIAQRGTYLQQKLKMSYYHQGRRRRGGHHRNCRMQQDQLATHAEDEENDEEGKLAVNGEDAFHDLHYATAANDAVEMQSSSF